MLRRLADTPERDREEDLNHVERHVLYNKLRGLKVQDVLNRTKWKRKSKTVLMTPDNVKTLRRR